MWMMISIYSWISFGKREKFSLQTFLGDLNLPYTENEKILESSFDYFLMEINELNYFS